MNTMRFKELDNKEICSPYTDIKLEKQLLAIKGLNCYNVKKQKSG